jgi:trehalose 6-phosphate phosphatase
VHWLDARETLFADLLKNTRLGVFSDFDGTLSPIVQERDKAAISVGRRQMLAELSERLPLVALVSGRAVADLRARVDLPQVIYIGNHGFERWTAEGVSLSPQAQHFREGLQAFIHTVELHPGMDLEDKGTTLAIHYRNVPDPVSVQESYPPLLEALAAKNGLKFSQGRMVFEIKPPLKINKGTALELLVLEFELNAVLFMGDDVTDVDAMMKARELRELGKIAAVNVGVESPEMPPAIRDYSDVFATGTDDVESLLGWLLTAISASAS